MQRMKTLWVGFSIGISLMISACGSDYHVPGRGNNNIVGVSEEDAMGDKKDDDNVYTLSSTVADVIHDPYFEDLGRLLFPVDLTVSEDMTLEEISSSSVYIWYNYIDPDKTVEIIQTLHDRAASGEQIFYDIYTEEEKAEDPSKEDTGIFFFRGNPGEKFAVVNAGGGFMYVGAMHDSFPHASENVTVSRTGEPCSPDCMGWRHLVSPQSFMPMKDFHMDSVLAREPWRMLRIVALLIADAGILAFIKREIGDYMLLRNQFVFFDFDEPLLLLLVDHIAIMGLFVFIGHYLSEGLKRMSCSKSDTRNRIPL